MCTPRDMWKVSTTMELIGSCALLSNEEQFSFFFFLVYITNAHLVTYEGIRRCREGMSGLTKKSDGRNSRSVSSQRETMTKTM